MRKEEEMFRIKKILSSHDVFKKFYHGERLLSDFTSHLKFINPFFLSVKILVIKQVICM